MEVSTMREESTCSWTENNCTLLKCHDCSITREGKTSVFLQTELFLLLQVGIFPKLRVREVDLEIATLFLLVLLLFCSCSNS